MADLAHLRHRIASIAELHDVVSAMRSLAAVRMQQAMESLAGARAYAETIAEGLGGAMEILADRHRGERPEFRTALDRLLPPPCREEGPGTGLLVFGAEHGFVGGFNEILLDRAQTLLPRGGKLFVIGSRCAAVAAERGLDLSMTRGMTTHHAGVPKIARGIAEALQTLIETGCLERVAVLFARSRGASRWELAHAVLLPVDLPSFRGRGRGVPPLTNLAPERLIARLAEEYFFARLSHAAMESLAAENAARLAAMSAARENIERKAAELREQENRLRQEEITTELLDIVTGAEVLLHHRNTTA